MKGYVYTINIDYPFKATCPYRENIGQHDGNIIY